MRRNPPPTPFPVRGIQSAHSGQSHCCWGVTGSSRRREPPYTEVAKDDQYVRQLFVLGYRGLAFTGEFKIGEASLSKFEEIQVDIQSSTTAATKPKYYSSDISRAILSVELKQSEGWQVRATDQECDEFSFDISCPQGLVEFADDGDKITSYRQDQAQYKSTASPTWIDISRTFPYSGALMGITQYQGQGPRRRWGWVSLRHGDKEVHRPRRNRYRRG